MNVGLSGTQLAAVKQESLRPVDDNGTENGAKPAIRSKKTTPMRRFGPLLDVA